ncbi:MAG: hypothetical protein Kapaf2KO_13410 [Candidatus Kapaibacteriales bacterium]
MKQTEYFKNKVLQKRPYIKLDWIVEVLNNPIRITVQDDNRIKHWAYIEELGKYLRVVTLEDGETVHNAFPDRDFKEENT